jgi:hypothetical protein
VLARLAAPCRRRRKRRLDPGGQNAFGLLTVVASTGKERTSASKMDEKKMWWWERSVLARGTNKRSAGSAAASIDDEDDKQGLGQAPGPSPGDEPMQLAIPGAVAVHGPGYRGDHDEAGDVSTVRVGRDDGRDDDDEAATDAPPIHVDSYAVNAGPTDEEIRQRILAGTAHAEVVTALGDVPKTRRTRWLALLLVLVAVGVAAIAVGVAVPLAARSQHADATTQVHGDDVVASLTYFEPQGSGGFASAIRAETRLINGVLVTSGALEVINCDPTACQVSDVSCAVGELYAHGCCAGEDCPNGTRCGEMCPTPPESCYLTDPTNTTCMRSECYTCQQDNGSDIYKLLDYVYEIDCLEVGTDIRPENGQTYKWAIYCGPVILGPVVEENKDLGEYQCGAARLGANYSDDNGGLLAPGAPCQWYALMECGCGPSDMYTFGLPDPTGPCLPDSGCPFLCEEAGPAYARELCHNFPGNISWWEAHFATSRSTSKESTSTVECSHHKPDDPQKPFYYSNRT